MQPHIPAVLVLNRTLQGQHSYSHSHATLAIIKARTRIAAIACSIDSAGDRIGGAS